MGTIQENIEAKEAKNKMEYFTSPHGHPKDRVMIHENSEIPREGQFIGLNGYQYLVKPGFEVDLPRPVLEMLRTRIKTETIQEKDQTFTRDIPRITFTVVAYDVTGMEKIEPEPDEQKAANDIFS